MHAVKPVGSPFSSPLGLQLALRLLTSPADHLSALLKASGWEWDDIGRVTERGRGRDLVFSGKEGAAVGDEARGRNEDLGEGGQQGTNHGHTYRRRPENTSPRWIEAMFLCIHLHP